jgi:hypothetical protein
MKRPFQMFHAILAKRFEALPGRSKVSRGEYVIEDSRSGKEFAMNRAWSMCFRPGQKVDMSMVFTENIKTTSCPGCRTESRVVGNELVRW